MVINYGDTYCNNIGEPNEHFCTEDVSVPLHVRCVYGHKEHLIKTQIIK